MPAIPSLHHKWGAKISLNRFIHFIVLRYYLFLYYNPIKRDEQTLQEDSDGLVQITSSRIRFDLNPSYFLEHSSLSMNSTMESIVDLGLKNRFPKSAPDHPDMMPLSVCPLFEDEGKFIG
jgi:hypothetical protein